ncbi:MAG: zinc ribbon domain-containing protein [Pyrinomonadaceae bacterium]
MYCPNCGQQQASSEIRFCSHCGFPLVGVARLLTSGGNLAGLTTNDAPEQRLSARQKGLRQGALLLFLGCLLAPTAAILHSQLNLPILFVPLCGILGIFGGLLRMLYAALFEDNYANSASSALPLSAMPAAGSKGNYQVPGARESTALPPYSPPAFSVSDVRAKSRQHTAEMAVPASPPASVTENTTRLLKDPPDADAS